METKNEKKEFYTFGMIKPDGIPHMKDIINMIYKSGLEIHFVKSAFLTNEVIDENYAHVKEKFPEDFKLLKESLKSGPVLLMLIYDPNGNAVKEYRKVLGVTKSWEAKPDTIRGKFGDRQKIYKNTAHGSGNAKEAQEEIVRFFKDDVEELLKSVFDYGGNNALKYGKEYTDDSISKITEDYHKKMEK